MSPMKLNHSLRLQIGLAHRLILLNQKFLQFLFQTEKNNFSLFSSLPQDSVGARDSLGNPTPSNASGQEKKLTTEPSKKIFIPKFAISGCQEIDHYLHDRSKVMRLLESTIKAIQRTKSTDSLSKSNLTEKEKESVKTLLVQRQKVFQSLLSTDRLVLEKMEWVKENFKNEILRGKSTAKKMECFKSSGAEDSAFFLSQLD